MLNRLFFGKSIAYHLAMLAITLYSIVAGLLLFQYYSSSIENAKIKEQNEIKNHKTIISLLFKEEEERIKGLVNNFSKEISTQKSQPTFFKQGQDELDLLFVKYRDKKEVSNFSFSIYDTDSIIEKTIENREDGIQFTYVYSKGSFLTAILYSKEIIDGNTGRVLGEIYGGTILNDNLDFLDNIKNNILSEHISLTIFNYVVTTTSTDEFKAIRFPIYQFIKQEKSIRHTKFYTVVKEPVYTVNNVSLNLIYGYRDSVTPKIEEDFFNMVLYALTSLLIAVLVIMFFAKKMILAPLSKLISVFENFGKTGVLNDSSLRIKEFDQIKTQLIKLVKEIDDNRNFTAQILDGAPIAIYYKTVDGVIEGCNSNFIDIFSFKDKESVIGKKPDALFFDKSYKEILEQDEKVLNTPHETHVFQSSNIKSKEDHYLDLIIYKKVIFSADDTIYGIIGAILDISEEKQLQRDLKEYQTKLLELNRDLESRVKREVEQRISVEFEKNKQQDLFMQQSKMAAMGEMISSIAHQWKQPLNTLALVIDNIVDAYNFGDLDKETLSTLSSSSKRQIIYMSKTIDDFKNFFKPNKLKEDFNVKKVIEETINMIAYHIEKNNITVKLTGGEDLTLFGPPNELKQVVINIINNSKDVFIERATIDNKITIELSKEDEKKIIKISDNGGGIPCEIFENIFSAYETTKGEEGTGLGLYMSKLIVEEGFKGKIFARNTEEGAEFIITIS